MDEIDKLELIQDAIEDVRAGTLPESVFFLVVASILEQQPYNDFSACSGCAYASDNVLLRANCVGCFGFNPRTHYVPDSSDAPTNWWVAKCHGGDV
jgi:hypothetical protein